MDVFYFTRNDLRLLFIAENPMTVIIQKTNPIIHPYESLCQQCMSSRQSSLNNTSGKRMGKKGSHSQTFHEYIHSKDRKETEVVSRLL